MKKDSLTSSFPKRLSFFPTYCQESPVQGWSEGLEQKFHLTHSSLILKWKSTWSLTVGQQLQNVCVSWFLVLFLHLQAVLSDTNIATPAILRLVTVSTSFVPVTSPDAISITMQSNNNCSPDNLTSIKMKSREAFNSCLSTVLYSPRIYNSSGPYPFISVGLNYPAFNSLQSKGVCL